MLLLPTNIGELLIIKDYDPTFLCTGEVFYTKQELLILLHQQEFLDPCHSLLKEEIFILCICQLNELMTSFKCSNILIHLHIV